MPFKFNPFTGNFDQTGSGGGGSSYIDGEVQNFSALPQTLGSPAVDSAYLVREAEGAWLLNRKPAGIYIRTANTGTRASDWTYAGEFPDVFNDANLVVYNNTDSTKNVKFDASAIATGTTRTLTVPDASGTIQLTGHAASHASSGSDPLAPSDIGAQSIFTSETITLSGDTTLSSARAKIWTVSSFSTNTRTITLPTSAASGDVAIVRAQTILGNIEIFSGSTLATMQTGAIQQNYRFVYTSSWALDPVTTHGHFASQIVSGTIAHERGGLEADVSAYSGLVKISGGSTSAVGIGTGSTEVAAGDHGHGNLSSDGKVGSDAGRVLVTTTAGAVTTLALGTAGQVLTVNSGANGVEFAAASGGGVTGAASSASDVLGVSGSNITGVDANADRIIFWDDSASALKHLTVGSGLSLTDTTLTATGGGVTTGSVDNAIIRADGTGGSTSQSSDLNIEDATTSTANNVTISNQHSGQTNSSLVLQPKGTGAFVLGPKPDGTTTGGNARGSRAVDLQWEPRFAATMVASGTGSAILNGLNNTASNTYAVAWGQSCTASGLRSTAGGFSATASGAYSGFAIGWNVTASGSYGASAIGAGSTSDRQGMLAFASGRPWSSNAGVAQNIVHVLHGKTTTNAAVELLAGDWNEGTVRLTVPSGRVMTGLLTIVGTRSDGSTVASYMRQVTIKNVGGTTSLVGTVNTVGTDEAGGTSISITANDTNDALKVEATGVASQIFRWVCTANMTEMTYGS